MSIFLLPNLVRLEFRVPPAGPLFQNEGRCSGFNIEIIFHSHANITHFHIKKVVHLASFWKWGFLELGSGLFSRSKKFGSALIRIRFGSWKVRRLNRAKHLKFYSTFYEHELCCICRILYLKLNDKLLLGFQENHSVLFARYVNYRELSIHVHCTWLVESILNKRMKRMLVGSIIRTNLWNYQFSWSGIFYICQEKVREFQKPLAVATWLRS